MPQDALAIDEKGAALDAHHLFPVHVFLLDDIVQSACCFVAVGEEIEREVVFGLEIFVGLEAVAGDPQNEGVQFFKFAMVVAKGLALFGAAGGVVPWIEIEHHVAALQLREGDLLAAGGWQGKIRGGLSGFGHFKAPVK